MGHSLSRAAAVALLLGLLFLLPGSASASWISLGGAEGTQVEVRVLDSSPDRILLECSVPGFYAEPIEIDGRTYHRISLAGESNLIEKGLPDLPHVCRSVIIPDQARMDVRVVDSVVEEFAAYPVAPSKGNILRTVNPADVPFVFDAFYERDQWWPVESARGGAPYILRDFRGLTVEILPFSAHGADGSLRVASRMTLEVAAAGLDTRNALVRGAPPEKVVAEFSRIYGRHFLNWETSRYVPVAEQGRMVVIVHDAFRAAMLPFVEWRNQMGIPTSLVDISTIGNTATLIDAYITNLYQTEGLAFALLVGDAAQIATPSAAGGASDPSYSLAAGTDNYPDLFVGRFSAETIAHVETQVARTVTYEKTPMAGAAWYHQGTGIASDQGPGDDGEYDYQHMNVIRLKLLTYSYSLVDQIYDPSATAAMVTSALNAGRGIVNYCGHGSMTSWGTTGFSNANVSALANDWMLPFICSVACVNGQFNAGTCFGEAWLRSTRAGNPIGAVATYMSSINQSWNPPMCGQDEVIDLLVNDEMRTFGGLCFNGSCQMMDEYGADGQNMFLTWHIFGDPSLAVRTATPAAMSVSHEGAILLTQTDYAVRVAGVHGALCALYADGVLYGSAYTDALGDATIQMADPPQEPTTLTLTVTAYNKIPVIDPVEVLPLNGPYIVLGGTSVLDEDSGNGNGACDAGETVGLTLTLRNVGIESADGVEATLSTLDPLAQILVPQRSFGKIMADSSATNAEPFVIEVSGDAPDQHPVPIAVNVHSLNGDWNASFNLVLIAPVLGAGPILIDDSLPPGNSNGSADPGESFYVQLRLANGGHGDARGMIATLSCASPDVVVLDGEGECLLAEAGSMGLLSSYQIEILSSCPSPTTLLLHVEVASEAGYGAALDYPLSVGAWSDHAETDQGWTLGLSGDTATAGRWVRAEPVGTQYNGQQVQPDLDHTPDPGALCFVTGNGAVGGAAPDSDVDGGRTTLLSPVFSLGGAVSATLEYWRWYTNNLGNNPGQDYWAVDVTADGSSWTHLEYTTASANSWNQYSFNLAEHVALTDAVRIRFIAEDLSPGSLVDAAVDDVTLTVVRAPVTGVDGANAGAPHGTLSFRPNPLGASGSIIYSLVRPTTVRLALYDVAGRLVRTLVDGPAAAGEHTVGFDAGTVPSGIYFVQIDTPEVTQFKQVTIVR